MAKGFLSKLLMGLSILLAAVLWLLSFIVPDSFSWFNLSWALIIVTSVFGVVFILTGLFEKNVGILKKSKIFLGAGMLIVTVFLLVNVAVIQDNLILPIIVVVIVAALVVSYIAVGGKKWDHGDNQSVGYKNYRQRKAQEEKNKDIEK